MLLSGIIMERTATDTLPVQEERSYRGLKAAGVEKSMIRALKTQLFQALEPEFERVPWYNRWQTVEREKQRFIDLARAEAVKWATGNGIVDEQLQSKVVEFSVLHTTLDISRMADQEFFRTWDDDDFDD